MTLLESGPIEKSKFYQEPKKKLKANLKIEVSDSYIENYEPNPISTSRGKQSTFSFRNSFNLQTSKASTSSSPTLNERRASAFDFSKLFSENNTIYDNFHKEDEFFSITMRKCHRRNMEDRVNLYFAVCVLIFNRLFSRRIQKLLSSEFMMVIEIPMPLNTYKEIFIRQSSVILKWLFIQKKL